MSTSPTGGCRPPELHLQTDILVPDLAAWRGQRLPQVPDAAAFDLAPDRVCEVISPSTAATDRAEKAPIYAREAVAHLWLVEPAARTLEACRLESGRSVLLGTWRDEATVRVEPFEAVGLELGGLWRAERRKRVGPRRLREAPARRAPRAEEGRGHERSQPPTPGAPW